MTRSKKFTSSMLSLLLCLLTLLITTTCSGSGAAPKGTLNPQPAAISADQQTLTYPLSGDIATFDPALVQDQDSINAIMLVYTGLVTLDTTLKVVDQMAQSQSLANDKTTWTFLLKPHLKFSDGSPLTSADVVWSLNRAIDPATKSAVSHYLSLIQDFDKFQTGQLTTLIGDSLLAPDPNTVIIKTSKPAAYFLQTLAYPDAFVVEKKLVDKYGTSFTQHLNEGGGSGPFKVLSYSHTSGITFVPDPDYYGAKPRLQEIVMSYFTTTEASYQAYQRGQVDLTIVPPEDFSQVIHKKGFLNVPQLSIIYLAMNYLSKPFDDIKIRQALALAINKTQLAHKLYKDIYIATNHIIPEGMPGYNPDLRGPGGVKSTTGDPALARKLFQEGLNESGYQSITALPKLQVSYYPHSQITRQFITAIVQMWQSTLGIHVQQQALDFYKLQDLQDNTRNNPHGLQIWRTAWGADYPDPQDWLSLFFQRGQGYNEQNYGQNTSSGAAEQQQVQLQMNNADVTPDTMARIKAYNKLEQAIVNDVGWIPIFQVATQYLVNQKIIGLKLNAQLVFPPDSWSNVYIAQ